jgi:hypothetical protein
MSAERTESEGFFEMLWDCDHCDTKGLLGKTQRHCPECGAPQNPDKRYLPPPDQQQRVVDHRYEGADRHCPACDAAMSARGTHCTRCGAPLDGSREVRGIAKPAPPARPRRRIWPYVVIALVVIGVAIWWLFLRSKDAELTVTGHRWERAIAIEEFRDLEESAWRDQVPSDASLPRCRRKQRSTKKVPDGEDCRTERVDRKDGTFEQVKKCKPVYRDEPVEDDWCTFRVRRWQRVDEVRASGRGLDAAWPTRVPAADVPAQLGARRAGARTQTLILELGGDSCDLSETAWRKYPDGQKVKVKVRARSGAVVCSSL